MFAIEEKTLDDAMHEIFKELLKSPTSIQVSKGNICGELIGALISISNPRARLSRTETKKMVFSALGEFLWYMTKSNESSFIEYYISQYKNFIELDNSGNKIIHGGYGKRIFDMNGINQFEKVISILKNKPNSRRAVIQLFSANDLIEEHKDIPCTTTLQFFIRNEKLYMYTSMRSNDAYKGIPHDVFAFTMLQELVAKELNLELGKYYHAVGNLHLYDSDKRKVEELISEGYQPTTLIMPEMPTKNNISSITEVLRIEKEIREAKTIDYANIKLDPYWKDLLRLLQVFTSTKKKDLMMVKMLRDEMNCDIYDIYISQKEKTLSK